MRRMELLVAHRSGGFVPRLILQKTKEIEKSSKQSEQMERWCEDSSNFGIDAYRLLVKFIGMAFRR